MILDPPPVPKLWTPPRPAIVRAAPDLPRRALDLMLDAQLLAAAFMPGLRGGARGATGNDGYTKLLLHCDGTDGSTTFNDASASARNVTSNGAAQISTAQSKFGGASASFNNSVSSFLSVADHADLRFGTDNMTIDAWIYINAHKNHNCVISKRDPGGANICWTLLIDASGALTWSDNFTAETTTATLSTGGWHHVAWVRSGSTNYLFINGGTPKTFSNSNNYSDTSIIKIGVDGSYDGVGTDGAGMNGYIDEIRISKGVARWTAPFAPPTAAYG